MRLVYLALAWVCGINAARALPQIGEFAWLAAVVVCVAAAFCFRRSTRLLLIAVLAAFASGGWRQATQPLASDIARHNGGAGAITGIVSAEPEYRGSRALLRVDTESIFVNSQTLPAGGLVLVETERGTAAVYGDRVRATGALQKPPTYDDFSYADYLARQGIFSHMRNAAVEVVSRGHGDFIHSLLMTLRRRINDNIAKTLPEPQAGLLSGILTGDESGISPEVEEAFSRAGASHVIAISGFNMVLVSAIVLRVTGALFGDKRLVSGVCAAVVIVMYTLFVGAGPGVARAALMSGLVVIGRPLRRRSWQPATLAFATLALVSHPGVLLDVSFQLSFCAVLGLTLFADPMSSRLRNLLDRLLPCRIARNAHGLLAEPLVATLATQITTLPLIILYFGQISLVALPVNLLILPVQSLLLALGLAGAGIGLLLQDLGALLLWANLPLLSWMIDVVRAFASWDMAQLTIAVDPRLIQAFYALFIGGAILHKAKRRIFERALKALGSQRMTLALSAVGATALFLMLAMR